MPTAVSIIREMGGGYKLARTADGREVLYNPANGGIQDVNTRAFIDQATVISNTGDYKPPGMPSMLPDPAQGTPGMAPIPQAAGQTAPPLSGWTPPGPTAPSQPANPQVPIFSGLRIIRNTGGGYAIGQLPDGRQVLYNPNNGAIQDINTRAYMGQVFGTKAPPGATPGMGPFPAPTQGGMETTPGQMEDGPTLAGPPRDGRAPMPKRQVTNPWQVNPAVWDSLGQVGQELALSFAEDEGWDARDYQRQIDATRPMGRAPRATSFGFAAPRPMR